MVSSEWAHTPVMHTVCRPFRVPHRTALLEGYVHMVIFRSLLFFKLTSIWILWSRSFQLLSGEDRIVLG
jgi:hypothetical protein